MNRAESAQGEPPDDLTGFPVMPVVAGETFYRSTARPRGFGWYSSDGRGRFDLTAPRGTLYIGRSVHCAAMERIAAPQESAPDSTGRVRRLGSLLQRGAVAKADADDILIWTLNSTTPFAAANLTATTAGTTFEVTNELAASGGESYDQPQRWATRFDSDGFAGIEYRSRFVTKEGLQEHALALFGPSGAYDGPFKAEDPPRTLTEVTTEAEIAIRRKPASITNIVKSI